MVKKYRVLFHGLTEDEEAFKARMVGLGAPGDTVDKMIREEVYLQDEKESFYIYQQTMKGRTQTGPVTKCRSGSRFQPCLESYCR